MTAGFLGRLPRVGVIAAASILFTATITFAASSTLAPATPAAPAAPAAEPQPLLVPDVRKLAYVFAKGALEQGGLAWRVEGAVPGYAANTVVSQSPAPGTKLVRDGAPIIVLRLARNPAYKEEGSPESESPYPGKPARVFGAAAPKPAKPAQPKAAAAAPAAKTATKPAARPATRPVAKAIAKRTPAFSVAGAPKEPLDELALPARAKALAAWLEQQRTPTTATVEHWLYQHNWIVTGASFGWSGGAEALRTLVEVDARAQELWGVGARSERLARRTLAEVEARSS